MNKYVLGFQQTDRSKLTVVGGKGASLGELSKINGIQVPDGFCVTTAAYKKITENDRELGGLLNDLAQLKASNSREISAISAKLRKLIEETTIPQDIAEEVAGSLAKLGDKLAFAVRSSATAEDLPTASFAGQQDTYLNILGQGAILKHISKCWASLFTERAVVYRIQNGFDHRAVQLSVVVQKMVFPEVAGILFTADPITSNRKILSIDASFGLGEAMVSGLVSADNYRVLDGAIIDKRMPAKKLAIYASKDGGTKAQDIESGQQDRQALTDEQILRLARVGREIEKHFGSPQDIEWCLAEDVFFIVQSRPITTLFPIPEANDRGNHVYLSVGHQQMMTDTIKPFGLSIFLLTAHGTMHPAGGRLFVDVTSRLASPASRKPVMDVLGKSDPLTKDALVTIVAREGFIKPSQADDEAPGRGTGNTGFLAHAQVENDPAIASDLIKRNQLGIEALKHAIQTKSGSELFAFILEDIQRLKKIVFDPRSMGVIMGAMNAALWLNDKMGEWLGEKNAADTLSRSVPNNITSEMGLALLDVADAIRPYPEVLEYLQQRKEDDLLDELAKLKGGSEVWAAICAYLEKYGMRCAGEIDITTTRWSEKPATLVPLILSNIKTFEPGASKQRFETGLQEALSKERELLEQLKQLPDGDQKAAETQQKISIVRNFAGYREYPKYSIVSRYFVYKKALLKEAESLLQDGVIRNKEDVFWLTFEEFRAVVLTRKLDPQVVSRRKDEYKVYEKLIPPRVITSDGEIVTGRYKRDELPADAIVGLAVSSGVVEGRARVILKMEDADIEDGDILVTAFTDPSWTALFVSIKGLVTEVGGLMTHGAVIAREYGLPAVVGVEAATKLIKDGQRIRVNGTDGYVEIV